MNGAVNAPRIISWNITLRCPLKCAHCYVDAGDKEADGVLSTHEAFSVIDQIHATGRPVVVLSGGEPLLREDIFDIARYGTEQGLRMVMGTSGYLIGHDIAGKLSDAGIRAVASHLLIFLATPSLISLPAVAGLTKLFRTRDIAKRLSSPGRTIFRRTLQDKPGLVFIRSSAGTGKKRR